MSRKNLTHRRPRPEEGSAAPGATPTHGGAPTAGGAAVQRSGAVQSIRREPRAARSERPAVQTEAHVQVDLSGLEELARMDPDAMAAMYDAQPLHKRLSEGDRITAEVIRVGGTEVLLDVGAKAEGTIDALEVPGVQPGDLIEAWVVWSNGEDIRLSTRLQGDIAASFLAEAAEAGIPVQATVTARTNGGFTVKVGDQTGFVPASHMERLRGADLDAFVGQTHSFLVLEHGERTVLSRRRLQEKELATRTQSLWDTLQPGERVNGTVTKAMDFGVFVDVDGVEGLLPRSNITSDAEADLSEEFPGGRQLSLRVDRVDRDAKRISFAMEGARPGSRGRRDKPAPSAGDAGFGTMAGLLSSWKK